MKKMCYILMMLLFLASCGDENSVPRTYPITAPDEAIGVGQKVLLTCGYTSENPNIMVTWYEGEKRLNTVPCSNSQFYWEPSREGILEVTAVVTDRERMYTCKGDFKVQRCDLAYGIIGDSKEKILRKASTAKDDGSSIDYGGSYSINPDVWTGQKYYYVRNAIEKIELTGKKFRYTSYTTLEDYHAFRAFLFATAYNSIKEIYGEAYEGARDVPPINSSQKEFMDYSIHHMPVSRFHGPNGRDVILYLWEDRIHIQPVAFVGNVLLGMECIYY